uniref:Uncharacterized protein n=1 Tax=Lepeophtheirus salmonis TaxID=72036 RepID=A0A0K2VEG9_LEPSM
MIIDNTSLRTRSRSLHGA